MGYSDAGLFLHPTFSWEVAAKLDIILQTGLDVITMCGASVRRQRQAADMFCGPGGGCRTKTYPPALYAVFFYMM